MSLRPIIKFFVAMVYYTVVLGEHLFPRAIPVCWSNMDNAPLVRCYGGPVFRSDGAGTVVLGAGLRARRIKKVKLIYCSGLIFYVCLIRYIRQTFFYGPRQ